jgi:DNA-binding GntR family transcriptional regulator
MSALDARDTIARRPLAAELADRLRDLIVSGEMPPGERVSEKALCERYGVSRTPLREALKILAREGLVTLEQNRGATVSAVTLEDVEEAFPIVAALEGLTGEHAARRATDSEIARARALHEEMAETMRAGDRARYWRLNDAFHALLSEAARNRMLAETKAGVELRLQRARRRASLEDTRWREAVEEHAAIVAALEARDPERLSALLRRHIENKRAALRRMMRDGADKPA